jgi:hypothetical protein
MAPTFASIHNSRKRISEVKLDRKRKWKSILDEIDLKEILVFEFRKWAFNFREE